MGYGRLTDADIKYLCEGENPMISPFCAIQAGKPSYGLSSAGYDFRLGEKHLRKKDYAKEPNSMLLDVKNPMQDAWYIASPDENGMIIVRPLECILAETVERIIMPDNVQGLVFGKSTYARNNIIVNATPLEPGWRGIVTLEIHNCDPFSAVALYPGQGIAQCVFDELENFPLRTYSNREAGGHYQDQKGVTVSR